MAQSAWLLVVLPALGAFVLLVGGRRTDAWGHLLGCATVLTSFVYGLMVFIEWLGFDAAERTRELGLGTWFAVNSLQVSYGLRLDPLSLAFVLLITGVGGLIHLYSIGYMEHDPGRRRFFGYFNLFIAAMLTLVLANNFVTLYLGWEGVGLASYLLIGWYQDRPSAATAAKKAFLFNRVGDVGLALAIFMIWRSLGTVQFSEVFARAGQISAPTLVAITLLLLLGACGKSGQFPLQAWLPDAMEGPTPVSALIHAATMVTAGVFMLARLSPLFELAPDAQAVVMFFGATTAFFAATIGLVQNDIKRIVAYSTCSQLGYMFVAMGAGAYSVGIFHLFTHAFFKALLFLGSGSVIYAMH
ncbi:MAG: NADH-quinone oxidoreductase subunit L, partial [Pseudonocardiales bacterium]|nr:NADH-quinone oxidoreductase subunit L [Pseudonocardiales bacterium]